MPNLYDMLAEAQQRHHELGDEFGLTPQQPRPR